MTITQIEQLVGALAQNPPQEPEAWLWQLLAAYDAPRATIARLQKGGLNLSKSEGELLWKNKLFFKAAGPLDDPAQLLQQAKTNAQIAKQAPRFHLVWTPERLLAHDTKLNESLDVTPAELATSFDFFLPLAGMERAQYQGENPADVKAAEKMSKLYDQIVKDNSAAPPEQTHGLNVFLSRLLFCFFAEDTGIFEKAQFTGAVESHTQDDGTDLAAYLERLFETLNTDHPQRSGLPNYLAAFPYVNGGLFRGQYAVPQFSRRSRSLLLECGTLDWAAIHPDIFGSMIQAVVDPGQRGGLGMHYTSVPNIMKVIKPLFLDELLDEFQAANGDKKRLGQLRHRICKLRLFDPACGSGNFLIIAYKELRLLEMLIIKQLGEFTYSEISLDQFYGIELDDFAHEVAMLSLWLAEHQMNQQFRAEFGHSQPALPLSASGHIVQGNATRLDWRSVCPLPTDGGEVMVLGNPPYLGGSLQSEAQKEDMAIVFKGIDGYKNLDYIACWFLKGTDYIREKKAKFAFVSTNSICQGEQVALLWKPLLSKKIEICFAHTSFKWTNNAKANAGVTVIVVGICNENTNSKKYLLTEERRQEVNKISPYLSSDAVIIVEKRGGNLSNLPQMDYGNKVVDGGNLILNESEKDNLLEKWPNAQPYIKCLAGSDDFINGYKRYCLWITADKVKDALEIDEIARRVKAVEKMRLESSKKATQEAANQAYAFGEIRYKPTSSIIIPSHSSENRDYIPMGFLDENTVISNAAFAIYDAEPWIFAILTSRMHMVWVGTVGGRLKMDYRYSAQLCYNTFPLPPLTAAQKAGLERHTRTVLAAREGYPERTLAELYDPNKMPEDLRAAHRVLDEAVEQCYRAKPFESDEERLAYLFRLYETMLAEERARGTLFAAEKAGKKKSTSK